MGRKVIVLSAEHAVKQFNNRALVALQRYLHMYMYNSVALAPSSLLRHGRAQERASTAI